MARSARGRTRNISLGPLVQHLPPPPLPGRNHTTTSRKQTHNNTKESGLNKPPQNPGLDTHCHLSGPAAQERVTTTSKGAHAHSPGQVAVWAPSLRRLTPQVVVQAGRPHCHLSGPAAQERVTTTSKGAQANIPRPARRITGLMYRHCPHEDASRCHHLLYRLSRTRKPKSRATSNTQCPITRI